MRRATFLSLIALSSVNAQTLYDAISKVPSLSNFTSFYRDNQVFANALLGNTSNYPITFLAPSNEAFQKYQEENGASLTALPPATLLAVLRYHSLVSSLSAQNLTTEGEQNGITVPTMLTTENNNRSVGVSMAARFGGVERAGGQVVFIRSAQAGPNRFLLSRQNAVSGTTIRSGMSSDLGIQALDSEGVWDGGRFHIVDGLLTPPQLCTRTIRNANLTALDNALNRTNLWSALDGSKNVTCLGPSNEAFVAAGSPDASLNETTLSGAILFHTLPEVAYSDYLYNGQEFKSLQNLTVRVRIQGEGPSRSVYFNNAKLVEPNVLTHNGLMHVLDAVMMPLEMMNATASGTPSSTPSQTAGASASRTGSAPTNVATGGAGIVLQTSGWFWTSSAFALVVNLLA